MPRGVGLLKRGSGIGSGCSGEGVWGGAGRGVPRC